MTWAKSLRGRFALGVAGVLLAALVAFGALVYVSLAQGLAASIDDSLALASAQALAAVDVEGGAVTYADSLPRGSAAADLVERGLTIRLVSADGRVRQAVGPYRDLPVEPADLAAVLDRRSVLSTYADPGGDDPVRVYSAPILVRDQVAAMVQVSQSLRPVRDTLDRLLTILLLGGPLLTVVAAVAGYALAGRALAPIDHITRTAQRISAEDLTQRLDLPAGDDEVGRLAATFDDMLGRLDAAFARERRFTADASHELRTPLAAMQAILGVIRAQPRTSRDYEHALADLDQEAGRLRVLVEELLWLARHDESSPSALGEVDLSLLLEDVGESLRSLADAKGLSLTCRIAEGLRLPGDRDDLIRLFVNLLDNAIAYTRAGAVTMVAVQAGGHIRVAVTDTGVGISTEHLDHVFERFYRVDPARASAGSGLGLAIAADIARGHGGRIDVVSAVGTGSTFTVWLPAWRAQVHAPTPDAA